MLIFLYKKIIQNVTLLISVTILIGENCLCDEVYLRKHKNSTLIDTNSSTPVLPNEHLNIKDNENSTSTDAGDAAYHVNDINMKNSNRERLLKPTEMLPLYLNLSENRGELCNRDCVNGQQRVCYYEFTLEFYQAMGVACGRCSQGVEADCKHSQCIVGDGVEKGVMSINRQIPGPAIQVCKGDLIIVDVHNHAHGTAAALHWHGLHMVDTPFMDGVPFLTQCPIPFTNTFRYKFNASEAGTQFYHSHAGHHKANGQYGPLIVRQPAKPLNRPYDYDLPEHYIFISDWMHAFAEQKFPGLPSSLGIFPDSVLINGRGVYTNPKTKEQTKVPPTIFYVSSGKRFRFRLINSASHACPFKIQIEKHNLTIIASDSFNVLPHTVDTLVSNSGERYDFILNANHSTGDFWIRVRGMGICSIHPIESYALISYIANEDVNNQDNLQIRPFPNYDEQYPSNIYLNHPNATCWVGRSDQCITELKAIENDKSLQYAKPNYKFYLSFQNYPVSNEKLFKPDQYIHFANLNSNLTIVGAINNISFIFPDYPPLTQPELIDEFQFCDSNNWPQKCAGRRLCPCTHRLKVELNSIVELFIVDESKNVGRMHHPFHLHGYRFMVTGLGQHPLGIPMNIGRAKNLESRRLLKAANTNPPFKDTVSIPSTGYAIVRFNASNPGFWLMHCHYEWHLAIGMGLVLQVGETSQMVKPPKKFPKCGSFMPPVSLVGN